MTTAQSLLTIAAESLALGAIALYGYLFISGLFHRPYKPVQPLIPAQLPIVSTPLTAGGNVQPEPAGAIVLVQPPTTATVSHYDAERSDRSIVLASHFQTVFAAITPTVPALPDLTALSDRELINRAKAAQFPQAKKWGRNRKLGSGERQRAITFLKTMALAQSI